MTTNTASTALNPWTVLAHMFLVGAFLAVAVVAYALVVGNEHAGSAAAITGVLLFGAHAAANRKAAH